MLSNALVQPIKWSLSRIFEQNLAFAQDKNQHRLDDDLGSDQAFTLPHAR